MTSPVAPTISATGISAPTFSQILSYLTLVYQGIFGADAYLGNDSQDGQLLAIIAQAIADSNAAIIAAYNAFSPATAQGTGLSSVVKINGLQRLVATNSTATLTVTGVAGTTLTNAQARDTNGNLWSLPSPTTIGSGGTASVLATCTALGAIAAAPGTITSINTPIYGWQSVTNPAAANVGQPVETDAALRLRQAASVALPSQTIFDGIWAAIEALPSVTRVTGYENNTTSTNGNGIPAYSLAFVVEGGVQASIAAAIAARIPPGIPTYGSTSVVVTDTYGSTRTINYSVPTENLISVALTIQHLAGWNAADIEPVIQANVAAAINALPIGGTVSFTQLYVAAYAALSQFPGTYTITAMTTKENAGSAGTSDITMAWNAVAYTAPANVTFTVL